MRNLFTDTRVNVTSRIEKGKTTFVRTIDQARTLTKKASYFYTVFDDKGVKVGFAIPK